MVNPPKTWKDEYVKYSILTCKTYINTINKYVLKTANMVVVAEFDGYMSVISLHPLVFNS